MKMKRFWGILFSITLMLGLMPGMSLTAYAATSHGITINTAQHGTVTASVNGSAATSAEEGATVTLTANPDNGYRLKSISGTYKGNTQETKGLNGNKTINGTYFNLNATDAAGAGWKLANNSTITITSKDTSVKIVKVDFNITQRGNSFNINNVSCSAGTKSLNGNTLSVSSINGTTVTLSSSANNAGYVRFNSVTIYGTGAVDTNLSISTTGDVNVRTFTMPVVAEGNVSITAVFEELPKYSVTLTGGGNATASPSGKTTQTGLTGAMDTVTFTANTGYHFTEFTDITNNGITATRTNDTTVTVSGTPNADASIVVPDAELAHTHTWATGWTSNETYHWHACTGEGATDACLNETGAAKAEHSYGDTGDARFTCTVCEYVDTTKQAAAVLADAKTTATATVNGVNANDYITADQDTVTNAKTTALNAINTATTEAEVTTALTNFNNAIASCTTQVVADQIAQVMSEVSAKTGSDMTYTGSPIQLINTPTTALPAGYTMKYAVTTENVKPTDESLYTTSIPSETEAGTYYVWYMVKGDDNHANTDPARVRDAISINPVDKSELNAAIASAEAYYDSIKDNAAYADIAATLKKAIDAAKAVAGNDNVTKETVSGMLSEVDTAASKAKDDVAAVDKQAAEEEAAKKAAEEEAAKQAADEAAAKAVTDKINALPENAGAGDKAAVEEARRAYDALTEDQKKLVPGDALSRLAAAEQQVAAAGEASETVKISDCKIRVKNLAYTGKRIKKPTVTVTYNGQKLKEGTDYTFTYNKKAKAIGAYKVTVKGKGRFTGSKKVTLKVVPKGTAFLKVAGGDKRVFLKWKSQKNITGYQIDYSLKKDFSDRKRVTIRKAKMPTQTPTKIIKKLKAGTTYYVRIRTYTRVKKKSYYSAWSKVKTVKTKAGRAGNESVEPEVETGIDGGDLSLEIDEISIDEISIDEAIDDGEVTVDEAVDVTVE